MIQMNFIFLICFASYTYWILGRACLGCGCGLVCRCLQCPMKISHHKVHFKRCLFCFFVSYFLYSVVNVFLMFFVLRILQEHLDLALWAWIVPSSIHQFVTEMMTFWRVKTTRMKTNEDEWRNVLTNVLTSLSWRFLRWTFWTFHFLLWICPIRSRSELDREYPCPGRGTVAHVFHRRGVVKFACWQDHSNNGGWLYGDWSNIWISFIAIRMLRLDPVNVCVPLSLTFHLMQSPGQKWAHVSWEFWDNGGSVVSAVPSPHSLHNTTIHKNTHICS